MTHDETPKREFDVKAYFAKLRQQYRRAKEHGFAPLETDKNGQKACIDMTTGQMRDRGTMLL